MIYFTEIDKDKNKILFQFFDRELPEGIAPGKETAMKKVKYPGGFQTNQIIGVYQKEIEFGGLFYGTYKVNGETLTAKDRADFILGEGRYKGQGLMGRPLRVGFPVPGHSPKGNLPGETPTLDITDEGYGGFVGEYVIEDFTPVVKSYFEVEYSIRLVPHQRQEKIRPTETTSVKITVNVNNAKAAGTRLQTKAKATKHPSLKKAGKAGKAATTTAAKAEPEKIQFEKDYKR
jgi:hypothetical protein